MHRKKSGFTLIEILIVLLILAVVSSIATLNIGAVSHTKFISQAGKVAGIFELLADYAVYTDSVVSCDVTQNGHLDCSYYKNGEWNQLPLTKIASWTWPEELKIKQVKINGGEVKLDQSIKFFPSGDFIPLSIQVSDDNFSVWIDNDLMGNFKVSS